ncbi:uncharacterized protein LOC130798987 [Amaranthus tricolor]|uniref:uncharacterized protein LOC130798987 n=1 Tax=Amaranthus tricolor TaxID=29722 RepID=UPI00258BD637|nr:uncharacterized protein LOC130798987 [Amaranthus tricolor]XP_057518065.1 uncharacterized protein LOC130798987 [Amaranthus tricolor]XP_057518066.1 uncharacterized protein LOC130798987 [Amaranthus tricolor]
MVGRGGGKKICSRSIAPGKLMSLVQASRMQLFSKQNVADQFNNSSNPHITDEIAHAVSKDLERQRTTYEAHINKAAPTELPATKSPTTDAPTLNDHNLIHGDDLQGYEETATPILNDQASEGVITLMDESILGKRKNRSNFVSRIEVGLQVNEALDP